MSLKTISLGRNLDSYAKVRAWIGSVVRNRRFQLGRRGVPWKAYLDIGCGPNTHGTFINLDYLWRPGVDVCWDITRGLPFADASMRGVYSEHCFEHFSVATASGIFREIRRVLSPGGVFRIIVPDAEIYLRAYIGQLGGDTTHRFPFQEAESRDANWTPLHSVNRVFYQDRESPFGHQTMYDYSMLKKLMENCGFSRVTRCGFQSGSDPVLLIDSPERRVESLYVEATP
jgi:predicted SAM-dependent methyltransferase